MCIGELANDTDDRAPQPLSITSIGAPARGSAIEVAGGIRYTPNPAFHGSDRFSYTITDGQFESTAEVTVDVIYLGSALWIPLNQCGGAQVLESGGSILGSMSGFAEDNAARIDGVHGKARASK